MARAIQSLRKCPLFQTQNLLHHFQFQHQITNPISCSAPIFSPQSSTPTQIRNSSYVAEMRKSAINDNMLRLLRNEIQYELDHSTHQQQPPAEINGFKVFERRGEKWISLEKQFGENEEIKVEVTMFDGSIRVPNEGEKKGLPGQDIQLHISMIVSIFRKNSKQVLEFICSAWPDTLAITKLFVRQQAKVPQQPYTGPKFRELDDELQNSLYDFLEERGIDDSLCTFLHKYVNYKEDAEYIRWMKSVKSVMEK
ncbi:hypothetical protein RDABS01_020113 [Bienertia sinuspersici]